MSTEGDAGAGGAEHVRAASSFSGAVTLPFGRGPEIVLPAGTIVALCGENGSGFGALLHEVTERILHEKPARGSGPSFALVARSRAITTGMDVTENVFLGDLRSRRIGPLPVGFDWAGMRAEAAQELAALGSTLSPMAAAGGLGEFDRLLVELARARRRGVSAVVLHEPTALLEAAESARLIAALGVLRDGGAAVLVLTQKPRQALGYADAVLVARDGAAVAQHPRSEWDADGADAVRDRILQEMVDRRQTVEVPAGYGGRSGVGVGSGSGSSARPGSGSAEGSGSGSGARSGSGAGSGSSEGQREGGGRPAASTSRPVEAGPRSEVLRITGWSTHDVLDPSRLVVQDAGLSVVAGEVVGLAGVDDSGADLLLLSVYGGQAGTNPSGSVFVRGERIDTSSIESSIAAGLFFVGTDSPRYRMRIVGGLVVPVPAGRVRGLAAMGMVERDAGLAEGGSGRFGPGLSGAGADLGRRALDAVRSISRDGDAAGRVRGLMREFPASDRLVLFLDEPFRGLAPEERDELLADLDRARAAGKGVVLLCSDLDLLLAVSDRVVTMSAGRVTGELPGGSPATAVAPLILPD
ncbi:hypothetical protein [Herbiconiux sp.]|uniref:hypothetical protein n=1 Tax=Herbiconiux sp. TaxID=1871186 RepID=UPI0025C1C19B|nr:hypothetical protein [Herbiconiux sp.]